MPEHDLLKRMIIAITRVHLSESELRAVKAGTNPQDLMDWNLCLYGAWCAIAFEEMRVADQFAANLINAAADAALVELRA